MGDDRALWLTRGDAPVDILFDIIDTRVNEAATRSVQRAARQSTLQGARDAGSQIGSHSLSPPLSFSSVP